MDCNKRGFEKYPRQNLGRGAYFQLHIFSVWSRCIVSFDFYVTGQRMSGKCPLLVQTFFKNNKWWAKCLTLNYFCRTILGLTGTMPSWLKSNKRGAGEATIRMSWCAFEGNLNCRHSGRPRWPPHNSSSYI